MMRKYCGGLVLAALCLGMSPASAVVIKMDASGEWLEVERYGTDLPCELNRECFFPSGSGVTFEVEILSDLLTSLENITILIDTWSVGAESGEYDIYDHSKGGGTLAKGSWSDYEMPFWLRSVTDGTLGSSAYLYFNGNGHLEDWRLGYDSCDEAEYLMSTRENTIYRSELGGCDAPEYTFEFQGLPAWSVPVATVPLPAPVLAFAGGLAALGAVRRLGKR